MNEIQTPPPPPPPPSSPKYLMLGLAGLIVGAVVVAVVLLVDGGDDASTTTAANPTVAASSSTLEPTTDASTTSRAPSTLPPFRGDTGDKAASGDPLGTFNFLQGVRFQQRDAGFTRVVFDFEEGDVPWWSVAYKAGPFIATNDEPIPVAGAKFLRVVLSSSGHDLSGPEPRITYNGAQRIEADTRSVSEIVLIDDFEGVSTWVIGVAGMRPFVVGTLTDPPRVYVDIED